MKHKANRKFWACYAELPEEIAALADECYRRMLVDPWHPSLQLKKVGRLWSVRVGLHYRALAVERDEFVVWYWIGPHATYDRLKRPV